MAKDKDRLHPVSMEEILSKQEMIRVYSVDRAGGILKDQFKFAAEEGDTAFENRVMALAQRFETYISTGEDK